MLRSVRRRYELEAWAREFALCPGIEAPEDWPAKSEVRPRGLPPLWHGDYSTGLSATFAAINGLRLVSACQCRLSKRDEQGLLALAWRWRADRETLQPDRGLRHGDWLRMVEALCEAFARLHGPFVKVRQPWRDQRPNRDEFFTSLERLIVGRQVILSLFAGAHYSVIRGYTPESLLLFDSGERYWMSRKCISLSGLDRLNRHRIVAASTLALSRSH
jgi:hypothetical protein